MHDWGSGDLLSGGVDGGGSVVGAAELSVVSWALDERVSVEGPGRLEGGSVGVAVAVVVEGEGVGETGSFALLCADGGGGVGT